MANNNKIKVTILLFVAISIISFLLFQLIKIYINFNSNYAYKMALEYSIPALTLSENNYATIEDMILSTIGINTNKPYEIIKGEIASLSNNSYSFQGSEANDIKNDESFTLKNSDINLGNNTSSNNSSNLPSSDIKVYDPNLKRTNMSIKPQILIYHSHTTESYVPFGPDNMDPTKNICAVGDELAKELEENYNISVIHDKTIHNAVEYTESYLRSGQTLSKYLKQYGDFQMIIDMHRDSLQSKSPDTIRYNGNNVAKFMFVMAKANPHYSKNISLVNSLIGISNKDFSGLCNGIYYYNVGTDYFNQSKSNNAFLIEIGCDKNSLTEAKATAKYLARIIAEQLKKSYN